MGSSWSVPHPADADVLLVSIETENKRIQRKK